VLYPAHRSPFKGRGILRGVPDFIMLVSLAALFPPLARPSHCAPEALRCVVDGETMTTPGGAGTSCQSHLQHPRARPSGLSHRVGAPTSGPSLCPGPMPQGVSYVQISVVYIRNIMPIRAPVGLSRVQSKPLPGRARTLHPPARPDLFHPMSGNRNS